MNHQTAKIIAESYRKQYEHILMTVGTDGIERMQSMRDHADVWERAAKMIALDKYPLGPQGADYVPQ